MSVIEASIPAVLRERAHLQPNDTAFTFIDYQPDPAGHAESLTWSQIHRRALNVAHEVRRCSSAGDRAVILAPQGLDYVAAFLGALEAGLVAVPLSVPFGPGDEHVHAVLRDSLPSAVLTTSSAVDLVNAVPCRPGTLRRWSRSTHWTWTRRENSMPRLKTRLRRICNTRRGRPVSRPGS